MGTNMSRGTEALATGKARAKQILNPAGTPVDGVTSSSYGALSKGYIEGRGGSGFLIAPKQQALSGGGFTAKTIDEWGAWMAYFMKIGRQTKFMEDKGYATVPAQWPHQFDLNQNPDTDYGEAEAYRKRLQKTISEQNRHAPIPGKLKSTWAAMKAKAPIWEEPTMTRQSLIDEALLIDIYDREHLEREAQRELKRQKAHG